MDKRKNILKKAVVLQIAIIMLLSISVIATSTQIKSIGAPEKETSTLQKISLPSLQEDNVILWDNYVITWNTAYHSQDDPPGEPEQWDSFVADDFMFTEETTVKWIYWQIYYGYAPAKDYQYDWNITFFNDDGTGNNPGTIYKGPITIYDSDIDKSLPYINETNNWACGATAFFPEPITFNADTKYWITIYSIGPIYPQTYLPVHNEATGGILLHEAKFISQHWGYPDWTDFTVVHGEPLDANFILGGDPPFEITIKKGLGATISISNNLPEGEDGLVHNMTVNITATGGFVLNPTKNVLVNEFNGQTTVKIRFFPIGFGSITINVACTSEDVGIGSKEATVKLLLILVL